MPRHIFILCVQIHNTHTHTHAHTRSHTHAHRVMNVLKTWLVSHFYDFEDEQMVKDVKEFFEASVVNGGDLVMAKAGAQLLRILERQVPYLRSGGHPVVGVCCVCRRTHDQVMAATSARGRRRPKSRTCSTSHHQRPSSGTSTPRTTWGITFSTSPPIGHLSLVRGSQIGYFLEGESS